MGPDRGESYGKGKVLCGVLTGCPHRVSSQGVLTGCPQGVLTGCPHRVSSQGVLRVSSGGPQDVLKVSSLQATLRFVFPMMLSVVLTEGPFCQLSVHYRRNAG